LPSAANNSRSNIAIFFYREVQPHQYTDKFMKLTTDIVDAGVNNYGGGHVFPKIYIDKGNAGRKFATGVSNAVGDFLAVSTTPEVNKKFPGP
jgi:hypothetical protein